MTFIRDPPRLGSRLSEGLAAGAPTASTAGAGGAPTAAAPTRMGRVEATTRYTGSGRGAETQLPFLSLVFCPQQLPSALCALKGYHKCAWPLASVPLFAGAASGCSWPRATATTPCRGAPPAGEHSLAALHWKDKAKGNGKKGAFGVVDVEALRTTSSLSRLRSIGLTPKIRKIIRKKIKDTSKAVKAARAALGW